MSGRLSKECEVSYIWLSRVCTDFMSFTCTCAFHPGTVTIAPINMGNSLPVKAEEKTRTNGQNFLFSKYHTNMHIDTESTCSHEK